MKPVTSVMLAFALAMCAEALCAQTTPAYTPLRPVADCIHPDQINEWHIVDARTAIVRTGPKRYLVKLLADCPRLGIGRTGLVFRANASNKATIGNRICGEAGETVRAPDQPPCGIQSVSMISASEFDSLSAKAIRHGTGAEVRPQKP